MVVSVAGEENRGMSLVIFSSFFQERDKDGGQGREGSSHCPFKRGRSSSLSYLYCSSVQLVLAEDSIGKLCASCCISRDGCSPASSSSLF